MTTEQKKDALLKALGEAWGKMFSDWKWKESAENPNSFVLDGTEGPYVFIPYLAGCRDAWDSELSVEYSPEEDTVAICLKYRPIKAKFKDDLVEIFEKHSPFQMSLSFDDNLTPVISRRAKVAPKDFKTFLGEFREVYDENYPLFYMVTVSAIEWYDGFCVECSEEC